MTIKEMRNIKETRGYSYAKLSEYTGIPAITIQKIFTGRTKNPRRATLDALERVLGGDEGFFIGKALSYERSGLTSDEDRDNRYLLKEDSAYYMEKQDGEYTLDDYYALPEERRVELIDGVYPEFDVNTYLDAEVAPVFFGSALNNFGVQELLDCFVEIAPNPRPTQAEERMVQPEEPKFTGFIFKITANIDPNHRSCTAFCKVCSGKFVRNAPYLHIRHNKTVRFSSPTQFMAQKKSSIDEA